jgi:hypothetical protein
MNSAAKNALLNKWIINQFYPGILRLFVSAHDEYNRWQETVKLLQRHLK